MMPERDPTLLLRLAAHLNMAQQLALQPRLTSNRFARGDFEERPWKGKGRRCYCARLRQPSRFATWLTSRCAARGSSASSRS
jgi:hypothetical protein